LQKRVKLKDIAEKTGFTINTVSRALKDRSDISDETKKIVNKAAEEMGYIRDFAASSMRSGQTNTIAVIVGDIANPFFGSLVRDIEISVKKSGFTVIIYNTSENSDQEQEAILSAYSRKVDGIIICPVQKNIDNIRLIQKLSVPFVLVGRYFKNLKVDTVHWNDLKAGELAAGYLLDRGHVNILYVGAPLYISSGKDRLQGYRRAFKKRNLPIKEEMIQITGAMEGRTRDVIIDILENGPSFTAVMAHSDLMAYEVLYALRDRLTHIEVIGCDNIQSKLMLPLSFPSIDSLDDEARICVELLLSRINNKNKNMPKPVVLDVELTNIQSCFKTSVRKQLR
jgi:LacI family transcriptional regulator